MGVKKEKATVDSPGKTEGKTSIAEKLKANAEKKQTEKKAGTKSTRGKGSTKKRIGGDVKAKRVGCLCFGAACLTLIASVALQFRVLFKNSKPVVITSSTLTDVIDIAELSTAQFTYNGVVELKHKEEDKKAYGFIKYNTVLKAGIDMHDVKFDIDHEKKTVGVMLPEIIINANLVDTESISFIPENTKIALSDAITKCEEDAQAEAEETTALKDIAKENLKSTIEALTAPLLHDQGYEIVWIETQMSEENNGETEEIDSEG